MIDLYTANTPNGYKVSIALEELEIPYKVHKVNLSEQEQKSSEQIPFAIKRYKDETKRLYQVLDNRLKDHEYLAGEYSIADIATWPWVRMHDWAEVSFDDMPNLRRWVDVIAERPAVIKGINVSEKLDLEKKKSKEELEVMGKKII